MENMFSSTFSTMNGTKIVLPRRNAAPRMPTMRVMAFVERHPWDRIWRSDINDSSSVLHASLYHKYEKLPAEGRFIDAKEEACSPNFTNCKTKVYVWEDRCKPCHGTGLVISHAGSRHGYPARRHTYTCICCTGVGFVRRSSARYIPDPESLAEDHVMTLDRPLTKERRTQKGLAQWLAGISGKSSATSRVPSARTSLEDELLRPVPAPSSAAAPFPASTKPSKPSAEPRKGFMPEQLDGYSLESMDDVEAGLAGMDGKKEGAAAYLNEQPTVVSVSSMDGDFGATQAPQKEAGSRR